MVFFSKGPKNEFETAVVNEPSVFEPLKVYCIYSYSSSTSTIPTFTDEGRMGGVCVGSGGKGG